MNELVVGPVMDRSRAATPTDPIGEAVPDTDPGDTPLEETAERANKSSRAPSSAENIECVAVLATPMIETRSGANRLRMTLRRLKGFGSGNQP